MLGQPLATLILEMIRICSSLSSWGRTQFTLLLRPFVIVAIKATSAAVSLTGCQIVKLGIAFEW